MRETVILLAVARRRAVKLRLTLPSGANRKGMAPFSSNQTAQAFRNSPTVSAGADMYERTRDGKRNSIAD